jgi:hypothetical protein
VDSNILFRVQLVTIAVILGMLSLPLYGAADGSNPVQSWDNLKQLNSGTRIQVEDMNRDSVKGKLIGVTDETLTFRTSKGEKSLNRADVYKVKNRDQNHHVRNGLIGMAVGAAILGAIAVGSSSNCQNCTNGAGGAAVGGAALGAIGFAFGSHKTIYKAPKITDRKKPQ